MGTEVTRAATPRGSPSSNDLVGQKLGRYDILMKLASGGMGAVYVAKAHGTAGFERLLAIKVLHPHLENEDEFIAMFLDEARLAARIRHPNVVGTLDISNDDDGSYFLVMEYVQGDHLGALLKASNRGTGKPMPVGVVVRIILDVLAGLAAAHRLIDEKGDPLNLVHRDISPHNVLVGTDGISRLTDFGVAKATVRLSQTREGTFKGKLAYMSPEQASSGQCDQRSDIFSMGIVFWEALTGRRLFKGENNGEVLHKILIADVPPPSEFVPEAAALDAIVKKALCKDVEGRFNSADEFIEAIEQLNLVTPSPHQLGKLVKEMLSDKINQEEKNIKEAAMLFSSSGEFSRSDSMFPMSSLRRKSKASLSASGSDPAGLKATGSQSQSQSVSVSPGSLIREEAIIRKLRVLVTVLVVTIVGIMAYLYLNPKPAAPNPRKMQNPTEAKPTNGEPRKTDAPLIQQPTALDPSAGTNTPTVSDNPENVEPSTKTKRPSKRDTKVNSSSPTIDPNPYRH